jgi:hypothetical protein
VDVAYVTTIRLGRSGVYTLEHKMQMFNLKII